MLDPVVLLPVGLGPVEDGHQLIARGDLQSEMVETGGTEVLVGGGEQIQVLAHLAGVEDERIPLLGAVVAFGPAEHLTEEVEQRRPAGVVEHGGVHADGHMVDDGAACGRTSGRAVIAPPG